MVRFRIFSTLQNRIAGMSVSRIMAQIEQRERTESRAGRGGRCAYTLWQRGLWHFFRYRGEGNAQARRLYLEAMKLDTEFAPSSARGYVLCRAD